MPPLSAIGISGLQAGEDVKPHTIRNHVAAPRDWWIQERRALRAKAARLRETGMKWKDVGKALGVSERAACAFGKRAKGAWGWPPSPALEQSERDPNTVDLFEDRIPTKAQPPESQDNDTTS